MHKPFRSQKKHMTSTHETIRMASAIQRSIASGRSSYVEMRAVSRIVAHNMKVVINSLRSIMNHQRSLELLAVSSTISSAYEYTLTSNGIIRQNDLEELMSSDLDISTLLVTMAEKTEIDNRADIDEEMSLLKDLLNRRQRLVERFKA
jgi:hypothetical protein